MRRFFIVTNLIKDPMQETTTCIREYLESRGAKTSVLMRDVQSKYERWESQEKNPLLVPDDTDCILVLGGDGTLLKAARDTIRLDIPLLGINLGNLGFLAEVEKSRITEALDRLLADDYLVEERMLLYGSLQREGETLGGAHALNDIVISRRGPLMVIPYKVVVNGQELACYHADGIIVSTPTGSTGYNLSAGGPIVSPGAELIVVTPICPHTLNTRSIILSPDDQVQIVMGSEQPDKDALLQADVNFDGGLFETARCLDTITIRRSERRTKLIRLSDTGFLRMLQKKMRET